MITLSMTWKPVILQNVTLWRLGAEGNSSDGEVAVECLSGVDNQQAAEKVAEFFSQVSKEYAPLDTINLPAYLPAEKCPQVDEYSVYQKIKKLKNTRSTFSIDIPNKLRKEFSPELAAPLKDIINNCLTKQYYPKLRLSYQLQKWHTLN